MHDTRRCPVRTQSRSSRRQDPWSTHASMASAIVNMVFPEHRARTETEEQHALNRSQLPRSPHLPSTWRTVTGKKKSARRHRVACISRVLVCSICLVSTTCQGTALALASRGAHLRSACKLTLPRAPAQPQGLGRRQHRSQLRFDDAGVELAVQHRACGGPGEHRRVPVLVRIERTCR